MISGVSGDERISLGCRHKDECWIFMSCQKCETVSVLDV